MKTNNKKFKKPINVMASSAIALTTLLSPLTMILPQSTSAQVIESRTIEEVTNPNLINSSLEINGNKLKHWIAGQALSDVKSNALNWTASGGKVSTSYSRSIQASGNGFIMENKGTQYFLIAQYIPTEIGKEYTISAAYTLAGGSATNNYLWFGRANKAGAADDIKYTANSGKASKTFIAEETSTLIFIQHVVTGTAATKTLKIQNLIAEKSTYQFAKDILDSYSDVDGNLLPTVNQNMITDLQNQINTITDSKKKSELQTRLNTMLAKAEQDTINAKNKVEGLFTDHKFNVLNSTTSQAAIDDAKAAVAKLQDGAEKTRLENLLSDAQDLLDAHSKAAQDLADAKVKTEGLFTDDKFNELNSTTNQSAIDDAKTAVAKLPEGAEKTQLENLINDAQDLFDAQSKAAQDLADAKAKAEGLFTDDKFNVLNGATNQSAIDDAKTAVAKLPDGAEKTRLENLINDAQDLFDAQSKAAQDLADAKAKAEGLFTDDKFNVLNGATNQFAIDDAKTAVAKLPDGAEKTRLENLINDAQDLFDAQSKAAQDLADAKAKAEGLFTDDKFKELNGTANQSAIDDAKAAVAKLPAGTEKTRLENLIKDAQGLLDAKTKAAQDAAIAKIKVESLFTDGNFNEISVITNQAAIDDAKTAVTKLPAGAEKTRLENLINDAQNLFDAKVKAAQELADAKAKLDALFTDDQYNSLKSSTNASAIEAAEDAVNKLPVGNEKTNLQNLINKAKDLLNESLYSFNLNTLNITTDSYITGQFKGDIKKLGYSINGVIMRGGDLKTDGTLSIYVGKGKIPNNATIVVYGYDQNNNIVTQSIVTNDSTIVVGKGTLTPNKLNLILDKNLTGNFSGDVKSLGYSVNGVVYNGGILHADGSFTVYVYGKIQSVNDDVKVIGYDKNKSIIAETKVLITGASGVVLSLNDYKIKNDKYIIGNFRADVNKVEVTINGTRSYGGTLAAGKFSFYAYGKIKAGDEVKLTALSKEGVNLSEQYLVIK